MDSYLNRQSKSFGKIILKENIRIGDQIYDENVRIITGKSIPITRERRPQFKNVYNNFDKKLISCIMDPKLKLNIMIINRLMIHIRKCRTSFIKPIEISFMRNKLNLNSFYIDNIEMFNVNIEESFIINDEPILRIFSSELHEILHEVCSVENLTMKKQLLILLLIKYIVEVVKK